MGKVIHFAIVTTASLKKDQATGKYRPPYSFRMMALHSERLGMQAVILRPENFHWQSKTITGWVGKQIGSKSETWSRQTLPLPDVVYDNVFVHLVMQGKTRELRRQCKLYGIPLFNPIVPGKYTVNTIMEKMSGVKQFIPETKMVHNSVDVTNMLRAHKTVYVKPSGGYGGQGVTRIDLESNGMYRVRVDRIGGKRVQINRLITATELRSLINKKRQVSHIVQQGLDLIKVDGGKVDFRVVVQRMKDGKWELTGIVPKIAKPGGVVTNLVAGGHKTTVAWLQDWAKRNGTELPIDGLEKAAVEIANVWSKRLPTLGIIGFDMGIDRSGKVWMIELNPKPARSLLTPQMRKKSFQAVAEHAYHLTIRA